MTKTKGDKHTDKGVQMTTTEESGQNPTPEGEGKIGYSIDFSIRNTDQDKLKLNLDSKSLEALSGDLHLHLHF